MADNDDRLNQLCQRLAADPTLRPLLTTGGVTPDRWTALATDATTALLDGIDDVAEQLGLDPPTMTIREFQPLPAALAGSATVEGWRCPQPHRCGRAELLAPGSTPTCGVTGQPLAAVRVITG